MYAAPARSPTLNRFFFRVCLLRILRFVGLYSFNCMMLLLFGVDFIVDYLILVSLMTLCRFRIVWNIKLVFRPISLSGVGLHTVEF